MSRIDDKKPLPPEVLVGALQDKIDTGPSNVRPARTVRCSEKPQSDTPRTDAADDVTIRFSERHARLRDLARQFERELAQAQHDLERAVANHAADLSAQSVTERFEPDDATRARVADIISTNPLIASLLYDIDLLPEQIRDRRRYGYMLAVIDHMLVFASRVSATERRAEYASKNPLGGPATMFEAMAERIRAGEDYYAVLEDYGLRHVDRSSKT